MSGFYLLDHPPASPQFYPSRNGSPTWAVSVHTSEGATGPGSALDLAGFIARRSDPGSYACIVDSETTVYLVPPDFTTFSVAASGYNSRTWSICLAGRSSDLNADDPNTRAMIARAGAAISALWTEQGVDITAASQWIGTDALNRAGLFCHGDVQPWDRSDAWSVHPDRARLDAALLFAIHPSPSPEDDDMRDALIRDPRNGAVYRITQPGNVAVHLSPPAYEDAMAAVRAGLIVDLGNVAPATLGNFGLIPSILESKG